MSGTWASGWATADIVTAAEFKKGVGCVADSTLGIAAASIDLTGLPTTYAHLLVMFMLRSDGAATNGLWRANNDSAANYDRQELTGSNATAAAAAAAGSTSGLLGRIPKSTDTASYMSSGLLVIPYYASTTTYKVGVIMFGGLNATNFFTGNESATWKSTSAISRLTFLPDAGNFIAGSRVSVYAMGA